MLKRPGEREKEKAVERKRKLWRKGCGKKLWKKSCGEKAGERMGGKNGLLTFLDPSCKKIRTSAKKRAGEMEKESQ